MALGALLLGCLVMVPASASRTAPESFSVFVDRYLDRFAAFHPSIASGNGLHGHDGELEDFREARIAAEVRWLRTTRRQLQAFDEMALTPDERVDRRILAGIVEGWLLDLDTLKTWRRNPMVYAAALADGLHGLVTMDSAPAAERLRDVVAKLDRTPSLLQAARRNIVSPPRVFVERTLAMLDGIVELLDHDLPLAFQDAGSAAQRQALARTSATARAALLGYRRDLETRVLPQANGTFAIGLAAVEARYRAEELIDLPAVELLRIGYRELAARQADFLASAAKIDPSRPPLEVWHAVQADHPARGDVVPAARTLVAELSAFVRERGLVDLPVDEPIQVAAAPAYDLGLASMHSSPPLESHPVASYYYVTDADPTWPEVRQDGWLRAFNYATLADITAHEVMPGHFVHSLYMRKTPGKVRRIWVGLNPFPQPSSGQDGWAHYAEQLVADEGFHGDDPRYRLAETAEALNRICRLIAGLKLHAGEWTVEQAAEFFVREAHLPEAQARREAIRGTYDPTYGGYFLGKLAALKLRDDYRAAQGSAFSLREFHARVMQNGIAPWWAHRQLLLPGDRGPVIQ
jgi:uncharacterized protein (DUF885 family)